MLYSLQIFTAFLHFIGGRGEHYSAAKARLYDCSMVTQITLKTESTPRLLSDTLSLRPAEVLGFIITVLLIWAFGLNRHLGKFAR